MFGKGARGNLGPLLPVEPNVGARGRLCGGAESNCSGDGCAGFEPDALSCRSVKALLSDAGCDFGDGGACEQTWSPIADISISSPQLEHLIVGKKLAGLMPPAARVAASDMVMTSPGLGISLFTNFSLRAA